MQISIVELGEKNSQLASGDANYCKTKQQFHAV